MYYLQSNDYYDLKIQFIAKDKFDNSGLAKDIESKRIIEIDGQNFKVIGAQGGCMDFLFEEVPLLNFVYKDLQLNVKALFKKFE